jgi:hypothetical protein
MIWKENCSVSRSLHAADTEISEVLNHSSRTCNKKSCNPYELGTSRSGHSCRIRCVFTIISQTDRLICQETFLTLSEPFTRHSNPT